LTNGRGVDVIIDTLGAQSAAEGLNLLAFNGHLVCVDDPPCPDRIRFDRAISIHAVMLGGAHGQHDRPAQRDLSVMLAELFDMTARGELQSMVTQVVSLAETVEALLALEHRHVRGKIVTRINVE
jgi:NADPH:quinone reductase